MSSPGARWTSTPTGVLAKRKLLDTKIDIPTEEECPVRRIGSMLR